MPSFQSLVVLAALCSSSIQAFQASLFCVERSMSSSALFSSSTAPVPSSSTKTKKAERVVPESLPQVYVYDHCPFCVRVRVALGIKNVKHRLHFLANDDVATPTQLVGKKIAPILQWNEVTMAESLDICQLLDQDERLGPVNAILPATGRTDLKQWQGGVRELLRGLQRPRYVATGLLPEFQQLDGRHAFVRKHALPGFSKEEWSSLSLQDQLTEYGELMARDPASDIEELNRQLVVLSDILYSKEHCSEGGVSYDDVDLFARLRSITIIDGVEWPEKLRAYMDHFAEMADIPLYDEMAL